MYVVEGVDGSGTLVLERSGLAVRSGNAATVANTVTIQAVNNGSKDSWLGEEGGGTFNVNGPVVASNYLIIRGGVTVNGNIAGEGTILVERGTVTLNGDNNGFIGTVSNNASNNARGVIAFTSADAGSSNAVWTINHDMRMEFSGTIAFGRINTYNQKMYYCDHTQNVTIEVGALGGESSFGNLAFFGDLVYATPNEKLANYTIKKVGDGKLTYASYGVPNIVVEEGELALAPTQYNDDHGIIGFDSIVVRSGAILSGTTTNGDKPAATQTISALTFAPGAILAPTVTYTAGEPASWTVSTITASEVSLQDMIVRLDVDSIAALANIPGEKPMVLSASTLNGKPNRVAQDTNGDSIAADGSNIWLVRRGASGVTLTAGRQNPGFMIIVQ